MALEIGGVSSALFLTAWVAIAVLFFWRFPTGFKRGAPSELSERARCGGAASRAASRSRVSSSAGASRERRGKLGYGRGLGLACSSYLCGAGLPIYWNELPQAASRIEAA